MAPLVAGLTSVKFSDNNVYFLIYNDLLIFLAYELKIETPHKIDII